MESQERIKRIMQKHGVQTSNVLTSFRKASSLFTIPASKDKSYIPMSVDQEVVDLRLELNKSFKDIVDEFLLRLRELLAVKYILDGEESKFSSSLLKAHEANNSTLLKTLLHFEIDAKVTVKALIFVRNDIAHRNSTSRDEGVLILILPKMIVGGAPVQSSRIDLAEKTLVKLEFERVERIILRGESISISEQELEGLVLTTKRLLFVVIHNLSDTYKEINPPVWERSFRAVSAYL